MLKLEDTLCRLLRRLVVLNLNNMKKPVKDLVDVLKFLYESNAIEDVWDEESLEDALDAWRFIIDEEKLTPENIKMTHRILMRRHLKGSYLGEFRQQPVWIGGREGLASILIPEAIKMWCKIVNKKNKKEHIIEKDHVEYEYIHPFIDGNGRTGRIFMNWQRVKNGLPILIIKEREKYAYYKWFTD